MDYIPKVEELSRPEWKLLRKRAIATLDPVCAICNGQIDMTARAFSPLAVEVDHIVPRSRGGALYDLDNLQLTHTKCNRKKGARMAEDYQGMKVENPVPLSNNW